MCVNKVCEQSNWEPSQRWVGWLQDRFGGIISSQMAEDSFNFQNNSKIVKGKKKFRRPEKSWGVAIARNVVNAVHHYEAVPIDGALATRSGRLKPDMFCQKVQDCTLDVKGIASTQSKPAWFSTNFENISRGAADLAMLRIISKHCESAQKFHQELPMVEFAWLGGFVCAKHKIMINHSGDEWSFGLNHFADSAAMGWPAFKGAAGGQLWFLPDHGATQPEFFVITDPRKIKACTFQWRCPAWQAEHGADKNVLIQHVAIRAFADGPVASLLEVAAHKSFWSLDVNWLKKVAIHIKLQVPSGATLFETLMALCTSVLNIDEFSAMEIVCMRLAAMKDKDKFCDDLVQCDEACDVLDANDIKAFNTEKKERMEHQETTKDFTREYGDRRKAMAKARAKGAPRAKARAAAASATPRLPPVGQIPHHEAKRWCPEGAFVWRSLKTGGWNGHMEPFKRISRSWARYGEDESLRMVLEGLWEQCCEKHGVDKKDCPMRGVFS